VQSLWCRRPRLRSAIPNSFSIARAVLGLAFPFIPQEWRLGVILIAVLTDALDGFTSRWLHVQSDSGRLLDPVADKVFVLMLAGTLLAEGVLHPLWALGLATRDLGMLLGAAYTLARGMWAIGRRMRPSLLGKCTTAAQFAVLLLLVAWGTAPIWLLAATTALSLAASIDYGRRFARLLADKSTPPANESLSV
jgi:cardiolipin synthase (CMP-forming)